MLARYRAKRRNINPPPRLAFYAELFDTALVVTSEMHENEPKSYDEAMQSRNKHKWYDAMLDEMNSLSNTCTLVKKPKDAKLVQCNWLFRV